MDKQKNLLKNCIELINKKFFIEAKKNLLEFIDKNKNLKIIPQIYYFLYLAHNGLGEINSAKKYLKKCISLDNKNCIYYNNLANIYLQQNQILEAEKNYLKSYSIKKNYLLVIVNLAIFYQNTGQIDKSKKFYHEAIKLSPERISIYFNLSRLDKEFIDDNKIKFLSSLMKKKDIELSEKAYGFFILAAYEKKRGNISKEIDYLKKGNELSYFSNEKNNNLTLEYWKNVVPKKYKDFKFKNYDLNLALKKINPIFVIGLPRSGSTLIEVLIQSSNKKIRSLGESSIINGIVASNFGDLKSLDIDLNFIEKKLLEKYSEKNFQFENNFFIDKSLENFFYINLILKIFPKAKFIHSKRNLKDNVLAIFKQSLSKLSWTHDLENILGYTENYLQVMNFYKKKYSENIIDITLEEISNNPLETSKKLISFCGLKWSEKIFSNFDKSNFLISTASNIQIRSRIKKYDYNQYTPYLGLLENFKKKYNWLN